MSADGHNAQGRPVSTEKPPAQAAEILAAVRELLLAASDAREGSLRFDQRVAARLVGLLEREAAQGAAAAAAERDGLLALLKGADAAQDLDALRARLCERIRRGECGLGDAALLEHLWRSALAQAGIDSPDYRWHPAQQGGS